MYLGSELSTQYSAQCSVRNLDVIGTVKDGDSTFSTSAFDSRADSWNKNHLQNRGNAESLLNRRISSGGGFNFQNRDSGMIHLCDSARLPGIPNYFVGEVRRDTMKQNAQNRYKRIHFDSKLAPIFPQLHIFFIYFISVPPLSTQTTLSISLCRLKCHSLRHGLF